MGMFDEVLVPCPKCGTDVTFQSKSGPCCLNTYSIHSIPESVLSGIAGDIEKCNHCGYEVKIADHNYEQLIDAWGYVQ